MPQTTARAGAHAAGGPFRGVHHTVPASKSCYLPSLSKLNTLDTLELRPMTA